MRGLSLHNPYAWLVRRKLKLIETRRGRISYRGPLVICSTKTFDYGAMDRLNAEKVFAGIAHEELSGLVMNGFTMALAELVDCRPLVASDYPRSLFFEEGRWAWVLENVQALVPVPVRGMQGLFPIDPKIVRLAA